MMAGGPVTGNALGDGNATTLCENGLVGAQGLEP